MAPFAGLQPVTSALRHRAHSSRVRARDSWRVVSAPRVLWVFGGAGLDAGIWRELRRRDATLSASIEHSVAIARELGFDDVLLTDNDLDVSPNELASHVRTLVTQAALIETWQSRGLVAAGMLGAGLGELAAAYAAGVLGLESFLSGGLSAVRAARSSPDSSVQLMIETDAQTARHFCATAPRRLTLVGGLTASASIAACASGDEHAIRAFVGRSTKVIDLDSGDTWFRIDNVPRFQNGLIHDRDGSAAPGSSAPLYSAAAGRRLTSPECDGMYVATVVSRPFYLDEALASALADRFNVLVCVATGREAMSHLREMARGEGVQVLAFPCTHPGGRMARAQAISTKVRTTLLTTGISSRGRLARPAPKERRIDTPRATAAGRQCAWYEQLRRTGPIQRLEDEDVWLVMDYADVKSVLGDDQTFAAVPMLESVEDVLVDMDEASISSLRRLFTSVLSYQRVATVAREVSAYARELVESGSERDEFDVVSMLAHPVANYVAGRLLGLDRETIETVGTDIGFGAVTPTVALYEDVSAKVASALSEVPLSDEVRRARPFDASQTRGFVRIFWIAGAMTNRLVLPSAVLLLLENPALQERLRADQSLVPGLVGETLRLHPPGASMPRLAMRDASVGGVRIPAGALVELRLDAANRDPRQFDMPSQVELDRQIRHLTFGHGFRRCPGARLGQSAIAAALTALVNVKPKSFREAESLTTLRWINSTSLNGLDRLLITWN